MKTKAHSCSAAGLSFQGIAAKVAAAVLVAATSALAQPNPDHPHGSRSPAVHRIALVTGDKPPADIKPDPQSGAGAPFSYDNTCGRCHDKQNQIRKGWHFNATPAVKHEVSVAPSAIQVGVTFSLKLTIDKQSASVSYKAAEKSIRDVVENLRKAAQAGEGPWKSVTVGGDREKIIIAAKDAGVAFDVTPDVAMPAPAAAPAPTTGAATAPAAPPAPVKKSELAVTVRSAARPYPPSGLRKGEPWVLADRVTGTQLPLSYRKWEGAFSPRDIGMSNWRFTHRFGRQMPGGGVGVMDDEKETEADQRWELSGKLEINCQACHSGSPQENMSLWAMHVDRGNFKWAAIGASPFGMVGGSVMSLPESALADEPETIEKLPKTFYNKSLFQLNPNNQLQEVFIHATNRMPADRCTFCHGNHGVGEDAPHTWETDRDVHLASGLTCVDCHRNGLDHQMSRGYEGETDEAAKATLTCRGCHYGEGVGAKMQGRLGAPYPKHVGLPTVHLEKIACTGCHAGPWPQAQAQLVQTARAHALGVHEKHSGDPVLPLISSPVFLKGHDGKIAPHYTMFPAYWARLKDDQVTPINPAVVTEFAKEMPSEGDVPALPFVKPKVVGPLPTPAQIQRVMAAMNAKKSDAGEVVYVSGGKLHRLDAQKKLAAADHKAAGAYSWAMGHDVRPAGRALGANGCADCHTTEAPIFFGKLKAAAPVEMAPAPEYTMAELQGQDATYWKAFAQSFVFRPMLKTVGLVCSAIIGLIVLAFACKAVVALTGRLAPKAPRKDEAGR